MYRCNLIGELHCQAIQMEHSPYTAERTQNAVYIVRCLWIAQICGSSMKKKTRPRHRNWAVSIIVHKLRTAICDMNRVIAKSVGPEIPYFTSMNEVEKIVYEPDLIRHGHSRHSRSRHGRSRHSRSRHGRSRHTQSVCRLLSTTISSLFVCWIRKI
jgi:hypothetical protein